MNKNINEINDQTNKGEIKMKKMKRILKNEKGLTLIELLAVIVILAIVAAIAVPAIGNIIDNSRDKAILADASNILAGAKLAVIDGACDSSDKTKITCDNDVLENVVEGIEIDGDDKVVKTAATGEWEVTYSKLAEIKNTEKFTVGTDFVPPAQTIDETSLNKAMNQ